MTDKPPHSTEAFKTTSNAGAPTSTQFLDSSSSIPASRPPSSYNSMGHMHPLDILDAVHQSSAQQRGKPPVRQRSKSTGHQPARLLTQEPADSPKQQPELKYHKLDLAPSPTMRNTQRYFEGTNTKMSWAMSQYLSEHPQQGASTYGRVHRRWL